MIRRFSGTCLFYIYLGQKEVETLSCTHTHTHTHAGTHANSPFFVTLAILPDPGGPRHKSTRLRKRLPPSSGSRARMPGPVKATKGIYRIGSTVSKALPAPTIYQFYHPRVSAENLGIQEAGGLEKGRLREIAVAG